MKKLFSLTIILGLLVGLMSCTKEGPAGPAGKNGTDGNANVTTYLFTDSATISWTGEYINLHYDSIFNLNDSTIRSSVILVYYQSQQFQTWYAVPGIGVSGVFQTRMTIANTMIQIQARDLDGSSWSGTSLPVLSAIKVCVIPSTTVIEMNAAGIHQENYQETMRYLFPDEEIL
jgi:hypothetical protein